MRWGVGRLGVLSTAALLVVVGCTSSHDAPSASGSTSSRAGATKFPDPVGGPLPSRQAQALQGVLADVVDPLVRPSPLGAPGVTAAVVSDHGSWNGAAGVDGFGRRLRPEAMMSIASITKTFVAAEVMQLARDGDVDLGHPISDYLSDSPANPNATVTQLLSMRSGLTDPPDRVENEMVKEQAATSSRHWSLQRVLTYLDPDATTPGGPPVYANVNYLLLGMLVEKVTGRPLSEVERAELIAPAGLVRVATQNTERPPTPVALASRRINPHPDGYLPDQAWGGSTSDSAGGLAADARAVATWGYQLYGARLLNPSSVQAMETPPSQETLANPPGVEYGLGTMVFEGLSTDPTYGHLGDFPGYTSILAVVPARHLSAALLVVDAKPFFALDAMRNLLSALE
jgi:D-alanyl-D-alanine carboxypeptidase